MSAELLVTNIKYNLNISPIQQSIAQACSMVFSESNTECHPVILMSNGGVEVHFGEAAEVFVIQVPSSIVDGGDNVVSISIVTRSPESVALCALVAVCVVDVAGGRILDESGVLGLGSELTMSALRELLFSKRVRPIRDIAALFPLSRYWSEIHEV